MFRLCLYNVYPYSPSLFHSLRLSASQLRSAGAGIIQDLFPRVSCISTLDISDNGETSNWINERKLLSAPTDLQHVFFPSAAFASVAIDTACTFLCSFQGWMLISSVSFLPSPDTRPSNTCCWARTLTSRAGTCSQTERDKQYRADSDICIHLFVWQKRVSKVTYKLAFRLRGQAAWSSLKISALLKGSIHLYSLSAAPVACCQLPKN